MFDLWVIIPAAGKSQRFRDAGYETPKSLLRLESPSGAILPMVTHVRLTIDPSFDPRRILVGLPMDYTTEDSMNFIGIEHTLGQADSIYQMIQNLPQEDSVLVLDCDMLLRSPDINRLIEMLGVYDVSIAVAKTFDPNSSRIDQIPYPTRFVEKEPISEYGIVGARAFKNIGLLSKALKRTIERYKALAQEPYLSVAINHYPGTKFAHVVTNFVDLGTPERIKAAGWRIVS